MPLPVTERGRRRWGQAGRSSTSCRRDCCVARRWRGGGRIVGESHIGFAHAEAEDDEDEPPHEQLVVVELLLPPPPSPLLLRLLPDGGWRLRRRRIAQFEGLVHTKDLLA